MRVEKFNTIFYYIINETYAFTKVKNTGKELTHVWYLVNELSHGFYTTMKGKEHTLQLMHTLVNLYYEYGNTDAIELIENCNKVLVNRAEEYSSDYDRLHNFKLAAERMKYLPARNACIFFMLKHLVCIDDIVNKKVKYSKEKIDEKFIDAINYCFLLYAILEEEEEEEQNEITA